MPATSSAEGDKLKASAYDVITISRFWGASAADMRRLGRFLRRADTYSRRIIVGINVGKDQVNTISGVNTDGLRAELELLPISPWGGVTHALNLMLAHALSKYPGTSALLFQSPEVEATEEDIAQLWRVLNTNSGSLLVAGRALVGHVNAGARGNGFYPLAGDTVPWNTLALWNANMLSTTGFPAVADRVSPPGMEEAAAIAVQQQLYGAENRIAALVCKEHPQWETCFEGDRAKRHVEKMRSKASRVHSILKMLGADAESTCVFICSDVDALKDAGLCRSKSTVDSCGDVIRNRNGS